MSVLTFTEYIPAREAGKSPRAKASDGLSYFLNKEVIDLIQYSIGTPLEVVTETKTGSAGKPYNVVKSARHQTQTHPPNSAVVSGVVSTDVRQQAFVPFVPVTAPVSAPITSSPVQERATLLSPPSSWHPAPDRERLIVRQSSLRAAVDWLNGNGDQSNHVLAVADSFVDWVFQVGVNASSDTATPTSPAQSALNEVRQKSADLRSAYLPNQLVCPNCGRSEYIKEGSQGFFCKRTEGALGCGYPPRGERLDALITYAEWQQCAPGVPWK